MAKTLGILLNNDFDLDIKVKKDAAGLITSGLVVGNSVYQQQTLLLVANKGEIKDRPLTGVGLNSFLLDDVGNDALFQEVSSQFSDDGMRVFSAKIVEGKMKVEANYEDGSDFK